ncbi:ABC transporter permease [Treponema sp.]|jgi:sulfonate transport system permease protein|uniref:ABC transporter permease n=1 Tax=Treponema sp. TaxID=166 RepID=UPI0025F22345|nr:ABC transporter permease [Treponema sp.]MBR4322224.1 ABC transporter permease [Treponema sp.]
MNKTKAILLRTLIPLGVIAAWLYATHFMDISQSILPRISGVKDGFVELVKSGTLQKDISISILRVIRGYFFSILTGVLLGTLMGMSSSVYKIFHGSLTTIRQIPNIAWIPLIILWFGIKELSKTVIIVMAAFFPIMTNTLNGILSTPQGYIELAQLYKLSRWKTFTKVYLPHALPHMLVGLKLGLGSSWMAVVAAELIASSSGIGYRLSDARSLMRSDIVIVCMIVIGIVGIIMDKLISLIFKYLTPWAKKKADV